MGFPVETMVFRKGFITNISGIQTILRTWSAWLPELRDGVKKSNELKRSGTFEAQPGNQLFGDVEI